jgi:hypothetical protein
VGEPAVQDFSFFETHLFFDHLRITTLAPSLSGKILVALLALASLGNAMTSEIVPVLFCTAQGSKVSSYFCSCLRFSDKNLPMLMPL